MGLESSIESRERVEGMPERIRKIAEALDRVESGRGGGINQADNLRQLGQHVKLLLEGDARTSDAPSEIEARMLRELAEKIRRLGDAGEEQKRKTEEARARNLREVAEQQRRREEYSLTATYSKSPEAHSELRAERRVQSTFSQCVVSANSVPRLLERVVIEGNPLVGTVINYRQTHLSRFSKGACQPSLEAIGRSQEAILRDLLVRQPQHVFCEGLFSDIRPGDTDRNERIKSKDFLAAFPS